MSLSEFAKEIVEDCFKDNLSLFRTTDYVNKFCKEVYSMEEVGKYIRQLRDQQNKTNLQKRTTNLPYVPNIPTYTKKRTKKNSKEKQTVTNQKPVMVPEVFI